MVLFKHMCWTSILVKQHTKYSILLLLKNSSVFRYKTSSEITKKKKKKREGTVLHTCGANPYQHHAYTTLPWKKNKNPELLQLNALMLFIAAIHLILCASQELQMLDFPSLKVLMNNKRTHFTKFIIHSVTCIRNRHTCLDYK